MIIFKLQFWLIITVRLILKFITNDVITITATSCRSGWLKQWSLSLVFVKSSSNLSCKT